MKVNLAKNINNAIDWLMEESCTWSLYNIDCLSLFWQKFIHFEEQLRSKNGFKHFSCFALAQFNSLLLYTSIELSLGFSNSCIPHSSEHC